MDYSDDNPQWLKRVVTTAEHVYEWMCFNVLLSLQSGGIPKPHPLFTPFLVHVTFAISLLQWVTFSSGWPVITNPTLVYEKSVSSLVGCQEKQNKTTKLKVSLKWQKSLIDRYYCLHSWFLHLLILYASGRKSKQWVYFKSKRQPQ